MRKLAKLGIGIGIIFLLFIILGASASNYSKTTEREETAIVVKNINDDLTGNELIHYNDLIRNNEKHIGKVMQYEGEIYSITNLGNNKYELKISIGNYFILPDKPIILNYEGKRVLDGDTVRFNGKLLGLSDEIFEDNPLPVFDAVALEVTIPAK
jgi:hypothetical protein